MKKIFTTFILLIGVSVAMGQEQIDFVVEVPTSWKLLDYSEEEGLWVYESADSTHRLTVSILYYSQEPSHIEQGQFLNDFIETRQEQSLTIHSDIQFSETDTTEYEGAWVAKFEENSANGRYATTKAICTRFGIANFYFESFSDKSEHDEISSEMLSTTGFAS